MNYRTEALAEFICYNWHCCPVPADIPEDCDCWGGEKCLKCIQRHAFDLEPRPGVSKK